jgi:hypothetical protein
MRAIMKQPIMNFYEKICEEKVINCQVIENQYSGHKKIEKTIFTKKVPSINTQSIIYFWMESTYSRFADSMGSIFYIEFLPYLKHIESCIRIQCRKLRAHKTEIAKLLVDNQKEIPIRYELHYQRKYFRRI